MTRVFLGLGGNVGARVKWLRKALEAFPAEIHVSRVSSIYETSAVGPRQRNFLNAVAEVSTTLSPQMLLQCLKNLEKRLGRRRRRRWGPREIDIDILFFGATIFRSTGLTVPHPRLLQRKFVLWPMAEIAPRWVHPEGGKTMARLRRELTDPDQRIKLHSTWKK